MLGHRIPEIVLGALLTILVFAMGFLAASQFLSQAPQVQTKHEPAKGTDQQRNVGPPPASKVGEHPQPTGDSIPQHAPELAIYGVRVGEGVLAIATLLLVGVTWILVFDARHNAQRQLRAYLSFVRWQAQGIGQAGTMTHMGFSIRWKNHGQTPALRITSIFGPTNLPEFNHGEPDFDAAEATQQSPMGPNEFFRTPIRYFTPEEIVASRTTPIQLRSAIRYDTVFPNVRHCRSDITLQFEYIGVAGVDAIRSGNISGENFSVRPVGAHNTLT